VGSPIKNRELNFQIKADHGVDGSIDGFFIFRSQLYPLSNMASKAMTSASCDKSGDNLSSASQKLSS
jgi:hypothetical protein